MDHLQEVFQYQKHDLFTHIYEVGMKSGLLQYLSLRNLIVMHKNFVYQLHQMFCCNKALKCIEVFFY